MAIEVTSFRLFQKNTLQGFLTLRLTNIGLEIRDATQHEKNGKRWIQLPSKPYEKNGETKWVYILDFYDRPKGDRFQELTLKALDEFTGSR